jgi:hypothetical protein
MAGQRPRNTNTGRSGKRPSRLADALAATQEHSVPLLPASEPTGPTRAVPYASASYPRVHETGAPPRRRATAHPAPSGAENGYRSSSAGAGAFASSDGYGAARGNAGPAHGAAWWPDASAAPDAFPSGPLAGDFSPGEEEPPGRPTILLPTIPSERLPAVIAEQDDRALAARADELPPTLLIRGAKKPARRYTLPVVPKRQGPRSFYAQFFASMGTAMVLFSALTLASPLGHSAAFASSFQSYANAVRWVPTPTPTPKPKPTPVPVVYAPPAGANPGQQAVINEIVAVFGPYAQGALNVARCESGYDPNAYNGYAIGGSHAEGVFQILYPSTWSGTSYAAQSPYNYVANIQAAHQIFSRDGYSWREWACQP